MGRRYQTQAMRILTFTSLFPNSLAPDQGIFLLQRTANLAHIADNDVQVVAPVPYVPMLFRHTARGRVADVPSSETIANLRVHHPRYPLIPKIAMPLHGLLMYIGSIGRVRALHRAKPFDCIDGHYVYPDGLAAVLIGKSLGIPVILTARGSDIHTFPHFATIRPQIRWALRQARAVAAVSNSLAERMLDLEPSLRKVEVIGNGVDTQRFFPEDRKVARQKIGVAADDKVVLCVAALRHVKGGDLLVHAAAMLKQDVPRLKVLFVGRGQELQNLQRLAAQLGCSDICRFVGAVPNGELGYYYSAADVSCLPSRNEGWPNVVLESMACGTPVVATRAGAIPEILKDDLGVLVQTTPESIRAGLLQGLQRTWSGKTLIGYAEHHTWQETARRVDSLLKSTVLTTPSPAELRYPSPI